jgi:hypothetical protein
MEETIRARDGMTQPERQFKEGDRVQLVRAMEGVAAGTYGTILTRFIASSLYDVHFDRRAAPRVVSGSNLAPAPREAAGS